MKRAALLLLPLAAGCVSDPMRFIPANERQVLQAEARLGTSATAPQPATRISVDDLLAQARQDQPAAGAAAVAPGTPAVPASGATPTAAPPAAEGRLSVQEMLAQARQVAPSAPQDAPAEGPRLVLRFSGDTVQPTEAQQTQVAAFIRRARGRNMIVSARSGGDLLGPRRAMAVARLVQSRFPDVELRFDAAAPGDEVSLAATRAPPEPSR